MDGDTLLDGEDDQDNDDYNNITELYEVVSDLDGNGGDARLVRQGPGLDPDDRPFGGVDWRVNPFNPCAPDMASRSCPPVHPVRAKQSPPSSSLLQPGARTLVCRVWASCLSGS